MGKRRDKGENSKRKEGREVKRKTMGRVEEGRTEETWKIREKILQQES